METRHPQHDMREKCFHPSGSFSEFFKEEVEQSIPIRFQKIVRKYADRIAVKTESAVLTYAELNAMANRVARAILAREGDKAGSIGLLLENGAELVAAMLGVLKAGKFFTLLDPAFPKARIVSILEDSESRLVIASRQVASWAKEIESNDCRFLEFESAHSRISDTELRLHASPKNFACIVYTSGSTGQPKGIVWAHRDLLHRIMLRTNENHPCEHDRVALLPAGTANAVTNIFLALLNGSTLLPFDVQKEGVTRLANWLLQERVSICPISSPLFRKLCETLTGEERFPDLRVIRLRSEAVYKTDVDLYKKYFPPTCIFLTGLATSETGQLTTCLINHDTEITGDEMPVGYAVEDKEISLLDETGNRVGFNEVGEIAVRSRYLSPGYWRKPDLDRAKFKPDPEDGAMRLCFTGDLGLMLPDGCLIHKGRKDFRVKVRGYGVEFAEVEKALLEHEGIREVVVVARQSQSGEARLVAYYIPFRDPGPNVSELRGFLKKKLPDYMIPSALVMVDAIPLTSNGKIDRKSLPDPKTSRPEIDTPFVSPRTSKEEELVKIWADLLDLDQIGIHDNFFDLGGHSLLASRVLSRIHDAFQIELPLSQFFETPTVADLTGYIEKTCAPPKRAETFSVQSTSRDGRFLLSFAQQRLWFLDQLEPGSAAYNLVSAARLKGRLNLTALEQSFNEIIRRHEALRTVFKAVDGEPVQVILPSVTIKLPIIDLSGMVSDTEREGEIGRLSTAEAQRPFDLARGPLLRATILRLSENEQVLLWVRHHIVFDGWSNGILARELSTLYEAFSSGRPSPLPVLPIQYADYARWERQRLQGRLLQAPLAYWKKKLADVPTLQLPRDRPRPPVRTHCGARRHFVLSERLSAELKNLSNRQSVTLFVTLLAAYQTLLYRTTGQNDIVTGSPIAGRNRTELETLIGFFLNMLVLRVDLSGNPTFRQLLARVRETCLEAYAHQDVPFEKLVEELQPQRDLSRNPLFQTTFAFQNTPKFSLNLAGLAVNDLEVCSGIVRFDLHLFMEEGEHGLRGYVDYNTDLFNAATITRMLGHFQTLLESIAARPDERIGSLPLLTEAELAQLLFQWNATRRDYPKDSCIHELFEAQSEKSPDAVALVFDGKELTYRELNRRANQLARHLKKHYVGPETLVGVCMERSLEMVVGLLGILKAGGAYVPLDPSYPKERLAFMLQDAHVPVLLTQAKIIEQLPEHTAETICLDTGWDAVALESVANPTSGAKPENLAYVIYTSGSTGRPKGAMNTHLGICNRLLWMQEAYRLNETDRVLQKTPFSFDVSVWEFFWPLLTGAQLVVARPGGHQDSAYLVELIAERKITTLHFVPSMLQIFLEQPGLQACNCLRRVICSGEALPTKLEERFFSRLGAELHNLYGPTEAAVDVMYWACRAGSDLETVPIGRPIANTQIYLLDPQLQPVPIGVPGELHIGGVGVARGYLNRPELSAEKFIPNPFSGEPQARLYKTGDLARYLPDGNVEFLGRFDHQVKLRGFRIEPGEIEAELGRHPGVCETVVALRDDDSEGPRLVAYVVPAEESVPTAGELRGFLRSKLPDYMTPAAFVFLGSLPLTANGKLDRRALPAPGTERPGLDDAFIAPRNAVETVLAAIWREVLGLARVGVRDNFFDLGGHSLRATQAVFRTRDALNVELPLQSFFQAPTIAELAAALMQAPGERLRIEETAQLLLEVAQLSEEEAQKMLDEKLR